MNNADFCVGLLPYGPDIFRGEKASANITLEAIKAFSAHWNLRGEEGNTYPRGAVCQCLIVE